MLVALVAHSPARLSAATFFWTNVAGGNWSTSSNWSPNGVPSYPDTANITASGSYTVTNSSSVRVAAFNLGAASGSQKLIVRNCGLESGKGTVGGRGILEMSGSTLSGKLVILSGGELRFDSTAGNSLYDLSLMNLGTVNQTSGGLSYWTSSPSYITNSGIWNIQGDFSFSAAYDPFQTIGDVYFPPPSFFYNSGVLRKSGGFNWAALSILLTNSTAGVLECASGQLVLPDGYSHTAGKIRLSGGGIVPYGSLVFAGGTLEGTGYYGGNTFLGGTISPGLNGTGKITFPSGLVLDSSVAVVIDVAGVTPETAYDQIAVAGAVEIKNSALQLGVTSSIPLDAKLFVITNYGSDPIIGSFSGRPDAGLFGVSTQLFRVFYSDGAGNSMAISRDDGRVRLAVVKTNQASHFELGGLGTNSATYSIYAASVLPTNQWQFLGNTTADSSGRFRFVDTNAFQFPGRFYRANKP